MRSFEEHLNEELRDPEFKKLYEKEERLASLAIAVAKAREKKGLSKKELAQKSHVTQHQLSKIENGMNFNVHAFIKVSNALGLRLTVTA